MEIQSATPRLPAPSLPGATRGKRTMLAKESMARLETLIINMLAEEPMTAHDIERATPFTRPSVNRRLVLMHLSGAIHPVENPVKRAGRTGRIWSIGPDPKELPETDEKPQRLITKSLPPCPGRDPLVTALFGPASNTPRCTHCRAFEGEPHVPGCDVARFV